MRNLSQNILSAFLVTLMLAFTVGVSVYQHYCACTNQQIASIFIERTCDVTHGETCCASGSTPKEDCCSEESNKNCEHENNCDIHGCCKTDIDIIQIENKYRAPEKQTIGFNLIPAEVLIVADIIADSETKLISENFYTDTSPPIYGRKFLIAVHQLKIDVPVS